MTQLFRSMFTLPFALFAMLGTYATPAQSHEVWLEPQIYQVEAGQDVDIRIRNGQRFSGISLPWFERNIGAVAVLEQGTPRPITGRLGDDPAIRLAQPAPGLAVVGYQSAGDTLTYTDAAKFAAFAEEKDLGDLVQAHAARGLPDTGFQERYWRYSKTYVAVAPMGDVAPGFDAGFGYETEFFLRTNPYQGGAAPLLEIELRYANQPRADAQIEVFAKAPDGTLAIDRLRTDAQGRAQLRAHRGYVYLLDAVVMRPLPGNEGPVWESLWASATFLVP